MFESSDHPFGRLGLSTDLIGALDAQGFTEPTPIQAQAIPALLEGRDVIGQAQTGTGKTAAFALPMLDRLDTEVRAPQVLVLTPTRELAQQVSEAVQAFGAQVRRLRIATVFGGQAYGPQLKALSAGAQVVVGTPGRIIDHLDRGTLQLDRLVGLVLDEADEMLRMGFLDDVTRVLEATPETRQVALFSATMPSAIRRLAERFLKRPLQVVIPPPERAESTITQKACLLHADDRLEVLARFLEVESPDAAIVFVRTRVGSQEVSDLLSARGFSCAVLNGDLPQAQRDLVVARVREGAIRVLIATDVAARGLDIERITHVFNLDVPSDPESYVHRIGRTGRAGREGTAILLHTSRERHKLARLEQVTGQPIQQVTPPTGAEVAERRQRAWMERIEAVLARPEREAVAERLAAWVEERGLTAADLAAAAVLMAHEEVTLDVPDVDVPAPRGARRSRQDAEGPASRGGGRGKPGTRRYRLDVGKVHGAHPRAVIDVVCRVSGLHPREVGDIVIEKHQTLVDLPKGMPHPVFTALQRARLGKRPLRLEPV